MKFLGRECGLLEEQEAQCLDIWELSRRYDDALHHRQDTSEGNSTSPIYK